jgi:hypothetical protein
MFCPFIAVATEGSNAYTCKKELCAIYDIEAECCSLLSLARHASSIDRKTYGD